MNPKTWKLTLRPYRPGDGDKIVSWLRDEMQFRQWSADRFGPYPLTGAALNAYYAAQADRDDYFPWTLCDENGPVGHFILRYPTPDRREVRLGFIIVDSEKRGKGLGRKMLHMAAGFAFDYLNAEKVSLGVFANNPSAHRCYRASGFRETARVALPMGGESWECIEMELRREDWK